MVKDKQNIYTYSCGYCGETNVHKIDNCCPVCGVGADWLYINEENVGDNDDFYYYGFNNIDNILEQKRIDMKRRDSYYNV